MNTIIVESNLTMVERINNRNFKRVFDDFLMRQPDPSTFGKWEYDFQHPYTFISLIEAKRKFGEKGWELGKLEHLLCLDKKEIGQKAPIIALGTVKTSQKSTRHTLPIYGEEYIYYSSDEYNLYPYVYSFSSDNFYLSESTWVSVYSEYGKILLVRKV